MLVTPELKIARNLPAERCGPAVAQRYTRWLATHHYENFNVVSGLLPRRLHQHFYNVYAYCRWSDDLGDEVATPMRALALLDAWETDLRLIYEPDRSPSHPVLIALRETIRAKDIPMQPFGDLLRAFRQDQKVHRYPDWDSVLDYCVYSANPVGRLVLYLCDYSDEARQQLSDYTCTALQLANFWQDVSSDYERGRIYLPFEDMQRFSADEGTIARREPTASFRALLRHEVDYARQLFNQGTPLIGLVDRELALDLDLFTRGGLEILHAIEQREYDTLTARPVISKTRKLGLLARALGGKLAIVRVGRPT